MRLIVETLMLQEPVSLKEMGKIVKRMREQHGNDATVYAESGCLRVVKKVRFKSVDFKKLGMRKI